MTNCCINPCSNNELTTYSSINDNFDFLNEDSLKNIPQIKDSNQGMDFIISKESYQILIKKIPKNIFTKKLCQNLNAKNIFYLIKQAINWILPVIIVKKDKRIKKYILMIKNYTKFGTKKILDELEELNTNNKIKKEDEPLLLQSLSDWVMLIELIMFLNNSCDNNNRIEPDYCRKNACSVYDINLWYNKNIEEVIKRYCFEGCYFLLQIKIKYNHENNNYNKFIKTPEIKVNKNSKNEVKKVFYLIEDFVKELSEEM